MELGIYTFAERTPDPETGETIGFGDAAAEPHRGDPAGGPGRAWTSSASASTTAPTSRCRRPPSCWAARRRSTERIRLTSAVSVISSDDPIRVFQDFATLDLLSGGRAEIMAGRGSFIESFPLFGYDLRAYDELFAEKLELLLRVREQEVLHWEGGEHTPPVDGRGVYPRPEQDPLPVWVAVGGTPQSVARAGALHLPLAIAIIGGQPARFRSLVELHREAARATGHPTRRDPDRHQRARVRRGHQPGGGGRLLRPVRAHDDPARARSAAGRR